MHLTLILASFVLFAQCQDDVDDDTRRRINEIFTPDNSSPGTNPTNPSTGAGTGTGTGDYVPVGLEEVPQTGLGDYGSAEKCGEGATKGLRMCVSYHMCDGRTNTIVQTGVTDGFGVIDIRFGTNACPHPLDVCCKLPEGGLNPNLPQPDTGTSPTPLPPTDTDTSPIVTRDPGPVTFPTSESPVNTPTPVIPVSTKPSYCGIRNPNGIDFKITGARDNEAEYGEFPWMVAIVNRNYVAMGLQSPLICGGSLITPNIVLTGAHCVSRSKTFDLAVRAGEWDTQTTRERIPYQERGVREIRVHPNFNNGNLHNDFAILVLQEGIIKADNVGTICLPAQGQRINSRNCFVSGWGKDEFGKKGKFQAILKKIELPLVQREPCQEALRSTRLGLQFVLDRSFICAGGERGKDACTGDGGSPLVCPDPQNPNRYLQVGIVAWGIGCGAQNVPGVYADVSRFRTWIDQELVRLNIDNSPYNL